MKAMTEREQTEHQENVSAVQSCVSTLRLTRVQDEDVLAAIMHLEDWVEENRDRWVT